tara:strand:+ start:2158 stop:2373 length:216 start_codon:yes stop_codon:yes gene_type:complete
MMNLFKRKEKHRFNITKKCIGHSDIWKRGKDGELHEVLVEGYECRKCGKILWLEAEFIIDLPRSMKYCDAG